MNDVIYGIQDFVLIEGKELPSVRPKIFFGKNAKEVSNKYIEKYAEINGYVEIKNGKFNERLFVTKEIYFLELFRLEHEYFVHNCK